MQKYIILSLILLSFSFSAIAYEYEDDIYYNPKKAENTSKSQKKPAAPSQYVDLNTIDVDEYNKRGAYYYSEIDTIGTAVQNEPDFQYTTQIQKFYNPTIVTDNAAVLQDVLANSYGNVQIVYNYDGIPSFVPYYYTAWPSYWAYSSWYSPWGWNIGIGPFSIGWNNWWTWGPSWGWTWGGPGWGPGWNWGWGGPGWNRPWSPGYMANYRPNGRTPFPNMSGRPMAGNFNGRPHNGRTQPGGMRASGGRFTTPTIQHGNSVRPGGISNPTAAHTGRTPGNFTGVPANRNLGNVKTAPSTGVTKQPGTVTTRPANTQRQSQSVKPSAPQGQRQQTTRPSTNSNRSGSFSGGHSSGGFSGGRSSGGFSGGGSRGGGGRSGGRR